MTKTRTARTAGELLNCPDPLGTIEMQIGAGCRTSSVIIVDRAGTATLVLPVRPLLKLRAICDLLIPEQAAHPFRDDAAYPFRDIVAH